MSQDAPAPEADEKKGLPIKTIIAVVVMLVVEAGVIIGAMTMLGGPSEVNAVTMETDPAAELERIREIAVLHEKFTNSRQGRVWIWDTEIIVRAKELNAPAVEAELEQKAALIRTGVSRIMSSAQHAYFNEPGLETITRQVYEFLNSPEVIGPDADGEPRITEVLIPSCIGFPADY